MKYCSNTIKLNIFVDVNNVLYEQNITWYIFNTLISWPDDDEKAKPQHNTHPYKTQQHTNLFLSIRRNIKRRVRTSIFLHSHI